MLNSLRLTKKAFINTHLLKPPLCTTDKIAFRFPICPRSLAQIIGIMTNITALGLNFAMLCQHGLNKVACKGQALWMVLQSAKLGNAYHQKSC
jgi:hypothetical protein